MKKQRSSKYKNAKKTLDKTKVYKIVNAINTIKSAKYSKMPESVELHINLSIDPKNTDQRVRFNTTLPHGTGKSLKVLIISNDPQTSTQNIIYKNVDAINQISSNQLVVGKDFDIVVTTPDLMKELAKVAKILGPKGLMPNPKNGTVTTDISKTISELQKGQVEIKNQNGHAVIHISVGKLDFETTKLTENITHIITELNKNTPSKLKKKFIQKAYIAGTMTPSLRIDV